MKTTSIVNSREDLSSSDLVISRFEYDALMSEMALKTESEPSLPTPEIDEKVRRLEFDMMILVGLVLVVIFLSRWS